MFSVFHRFNVLFFPVSKNNSKINFYYITLHSQLVMMFVYHFKCFFFIVLIFLCCRYLCYQLTLLVSFLLPIEVCLFNSIINGVRIVLGVKFFSVSLLILSYLIFAIIFFITTRRKIVMNIIRILF